MTTNKEWEEEKRECQKDDNEILDNDEADARSSWLGADEKDWCQLVQLNEWEINFLADYVGLVIDEENDDLGDNSDTVLKLKILWNKLNVVDYEVE